MPGAISQGKASKILGDRSVRGNPLTGKQRRLSGAVATGKDKLKSFAMKARATKIT